MSGAPLEDESSPSDAPPLGMTFHGCDDEIAAGCIEDFVTKLGRVLSCDFGRS